MCVTVDIHKPTYEIGLDTGSETLEKLQNHDTFLEMILVSVQKLNHVVDRNSRPCYHCQMITFYSRSNSYHLRIMNENRSITRMTSWSLPFCGYVNGK